MYEMENKIHVPNHQPNNVNPGLINPVYGCFSLGGTIDVSYCDYLRRVPPPLNYGLLIRWEFQNPKLEVPTMYKAYIRPRFQGISQQNMILYGNNVPPSIGS